MVLLQWIPAVWVIWLLPPRQADGDPVVVANEGVRFLCKKWQHKS